MPTENVTYPIVTVPNDSSNPNFGMGCYVLTYEKIVTTLGFERACDRATRAVQWLAKVGAANVPNVNEKNVGTVAGYAEYADVMSEVYAHVSRTGAKCPIDLSPQLEGYEGYRVEVTTHYGERRRFIVGKSTGWIPCHLEIKTRRSSGGVPAEKRYETVRVLERVR